VKKVEKLSNTNTHLRGFKSILHPMPYNHPVGIARTDLSSWGSTWLVVRTNFPKGNFPRTS
jgi:hypothetical protein